MFSVNPPRTVIKSMHVLFVHVHEVETVAVAIPNGALAVRENCGLIRAFRSRYLTNVITQILRFQPLWRRIQ